MINNSAQQLFDYTNKNELTIKSTFDIDIYLTAKCCQSNKWERKVDYIRSETSTKEIYKDIPEYEGRYQVSNFGRVKSLVFKKERILKQHRNKNDYLIVGLSLNGKEKKKRVHILVAQTFLQYNPDNPFNLIVDHINNVRTDNRVWNLQVITVRENSSKDQFKRNRTSKYTGVSFSRKHKKWRSQIQLGKTNYHLGFFKSEQEASLEYKRALIHLERSIDGLDSYHFEKAPKKNKVFLNEMYQFYFDKNL